nr:HAD family hydrolase [Ardenticatena sp.]
MRALLLDLDDTLLLNSVDAFLPRYFCALSAAFADIVPPECFLDTLRKATMTTIANTDPTRTNADVFWDAWEALLPELRAHREEIQQRIERFYREVFPTLRGDTRPVEGGRELVAWAQENGLAVVIATNPIFPMAAIRERLRWANLDDFDFDLVTSYENMHFTKPQPHYYREIANRLGIAPEEALMAGNHVSNDLIPAHAVGMRTFLVDVAPLQDAPFTPDGEGDLHALREWLAQQMEGARR